MTFSAGPAENSALVADNASARATVLVVDDEALVRWSLAERLSQDGHRVLEAQTAAGALEQMAAGVDLVLLDYRLPDRDGLYVLHTVKEQYPDTLVILMTAYSTIDNAVEAMKLGAFHYFNKPFAIDDVVSLVDKALETGRLRREVHALRTSADRVHSFDRMVGNSSVMVAVKSLLARIASSPASTVLLTGETGTGKDLAAKTIHFNSDRAGRPFVTITCSALPEHLLESELFGHERGAFTDARQQKRGLIETADGGTVFLDEIAEMAPTLQSKLLHFIEDKTFKRIGGLHDIHVDVRVVAATNHNLENAVREGRFRTDLFYRLQVMPIQLPPLRIRHGDVPLLASYYVDRYNAEFKKKIRLVAPDALAILERYQWPGNVRELRNVIERAVLLNDRDEVQARDVESLSPAMARAPFELPHQGVNLDEVERHLVAQAMQRSNGNLTHAGHLLGINRDQVRYRLEKYGLSKYLS